MGLALPARKNMAPRPLAGVRHAGDGMRAPRRVAVHKIADSRFRAARRLRVYRVCGINRQTS